jgi:uncharacterized protein with predicted RNA binding PUA domain
MSSREILSKLRSIANYQFGKGAGEALLPDSIKVSFSPRTGRIRHVYYRRKLLATLRPTDGFLALTPEGAARLLRSLPPPKLRVVLSDDVSIPVLSGRNAFAKHVKDADPNIRPHDEVIVTDEGDRLLAVGRAVLSGKEMLIFKRGVAVKVRRGALEGHGHEEDKPPAS